MPYLMKTFYDSLVYGIAVHRVPSFGHSLESDIQSTHIVCRSGANLLLKNNVLILYDFLSNVLYLYSW